MGFALPGGGSCGVLLVTVGGLWALGLVPLGRVGLRDIARAAPAALKAGEALLADQTQPVFPVLIVLIGEDDLQLALGENICGPARGRGEVR